MCLKFDTRDECAMHEQYLTPKPPEGAVAHGGLSLTFQRHFFFQMGFIFLYIQHFLFFLVKIFKKLHFGNKAHFSLNFLNLCCRLIQLFLTILAVMFQYLPTAS